jgi:hypothetical protein
VTSDCQKSGVAYWAVVMLTGVLLLALYPLSTGPAEWMRDRGWLSERAVEALDWFYSPLPWTYQHSPACVQSASRWYGSTWH